MIHAKHPDGRTATFNQETWDKMATHKNGWQPVSDKPKELSAAMAKAGKKKAGKTAVVADDPNQVGEQEEEGDED